MDVIGRASISEGGGIALDIIELGGRAEGPFATVGIPDTGLIFVGEGLIAELIWLPALDAPIGAVFAVFAVFADRFARVRSGEIDILSNFFESAASSASSSESDSESDSDSTVADGT